MNEKENITRGLITLGAIIIAIGIVTL